MVDGALAPITRFSDKYISPVGDYVAWSVTTPENWEAAGLVWISGWSTFIGPSVGTLGPVTLERLVLPFVPAVAAPAGPGPTSAPAAPGGRAGAGNDASKGVARACNGPGCICFTARTPVLMADGTTKAIEEVEPGDYVLADDPTDDRPPEAKEVLETHVTLASTIYSIRVEGSDEVIESTSRHPFWTQRGWVTAEELKSTDVLMDSNGDAVHVESIVAASRDEVTYNLTVDEHHTFFVLAGQVAVLVHNVDPWDILFSQNNYASTFEKGPWAGKTVEEAVAAARKLGRLPDGLTLNAMKVNDRWVTLNNRTLAVAQRANLPQVHPVDAGPGGLNTLNQLLRNSGLLGPVAEAQQRCP